VFFCVKIDRSPERDYDILKKIGYADEMEPQQTMRRRKR
jgi:hypothetical protein